MARKTKAKGKSIKKMSHADLPASVGLVKEIRLELLNKFDSLEHRFESLEHRFESLEHRFESLDHRFESLDHRFDSQDSSINAKFHRIMTIVEEQRSENRIVLDAIQGMIDRQDRMEVDLREVRQTVQWLATARRDNT